MAKRVWLLHATTARVGGPHLLLLVGAHSVVDVHACLGRLAPDHSLADERRRLLPAVMLGHLSLGWWWFGAVVADKMVGVSQQQ